MMTRLGRRSEFADSDVEESSYDGGDLDVEEEEEILWRYGVSQRSGRSGLLRAEADCSTHYYVDHVKPEIVCPKHRTVENSTLIRIIDHKMDNHFSKMLHVVESLGVRLSKMDMRSSQLEASVDQLNSSFEWQRERTHEKLRRLEEMMKEVQGAVKDLKDKYEIAESKIELTKLQISKNHLPQLKTGTRPTNVVKPTSAIFSHHANQQVISPDVTTLTHAGLDLMYPSNPAYQNPLPHASAQAPIQLPPVGCYILPPTTPYQLPLSTPEQKYGEHGMYQDQEYQPMFTAPSMSNESARNPTQLTQRNFHPYPAVQHQQDYSVNYGEGLQPQPQFHNFGPYSQFSGTSRKAHDSQVGIPHFDSHYELFSEKRHYTDYNSCTYGVPTKDDQTLPQFSPVERNIIEALEHPLPHALPMASFIDEEPNINSSKNRASTDEASIIDKVTSMGFSRDMVKVIVKKLKENGQPIHLNEVLDTT